MIIINADDFGMSKEINEGIALAARAGAINSASIIMKEEMEEAVIFAKKYKIKCGIHLYYPGKVYPIFLKSLLSAGFRRKLENSFEKQILELKNKMEIEHVDSHKHIHMFPPIFSIVLKLAKKYNLRIRLSKNIEISWLNRFGLRIFYSVDKKKTKAFGVKTVDSYESNYKRLEYWFHKLKNAKQDAELIVHPGIKDDKIRRTKELERLIHLKNAE